MKSCVTFHCLLVYVSSIVLGVLEVCRFEHIVQNFVGVPSTTVMSSHPVKGLFRELSVDGDIMFIGCDSKITGIIPLNRFQQLFPKLIIKS